MNKDDPLDKTVELGAELTESGLSLKAKGRFFAAIDRLGGNVVDRLNIALERKQIPERAEIEGQRRLIEAMADHAIDRMKTDPDFADRAAANWLRTMGQRQENKDGVVRHAIEDLKRDSRVEQDDVDAELDPLFLNKIERHAEDASTEELRERWGRVLAAEVRKPGTITPRAMRIVDELDASTALLFEKFCESRIDTSVPKCLSGELKFTETARLVDAGLLIDPGMGQKMNYFEMTGSDGVAAWFARFGIFGVSIPRSAEIVSNGAKSTAPLAVGRKENEKPYSPVYVLTDAGEAIASILPLREEVALRHYALAIKDVVGGAPVRLFRKSGQAYTSFAVV